MSKLTDPLHGVLWNGAWVRIAPAVTVALVVVGAAPPRALAQSSTTEPATMVQADAPTFSADVAPILQESCQECHRPEGIGPMSLMTYQEVRRWATRIKDRVERRIMPPWHIDRTVGIRDFANDISLTDEEIGTIVAWVEAGVPQGDPADMPPPPEWPDPIRWALEDQLGPPDLVVRSTPYDVVANGQDQWWMPVVDIEGLPEERWIRAAEFKPAYPLGKKVVHHGHATLVLEGGERGSAVALARYGVGKSWEVYPENTGVRVPAGPARISWNLHYFPIGEEVPNDVVEVGVWFYPEADRPELASSGEQRFLIDGTHQTGQRARDLIIPPHGKLILEGAHTLDQPAVIHSFRPHMHMRGTQMTMEAIYPDGRREMLSQVNKYDHNWQISYQYADGAKPLLPAGTVLLFHSMYDNTVDNPINPDPDQWVGFGARGVDEMSHAWVGITYVDEEEFQRLVAQRNRIVQAGG
jgi:hypothetical protein